MSEEYFDIEGAIDRIVVAINGLDTANARRDRCAAAALAALLSRGVGHGSREQLVDWAVKFADALIAELDKTMP